MTSLVFVDVPVPEPALELAPAPILFPDPLMESLRIMRASTFAEAQAASYGTAAPSDLGDDFPGLPWVAFEVVDVDTSLHPFRETAFVQLTTWAETADQALRLAQVVRAVLVAHPGDEKVSSVVGRGRRGPIPATDPDTRQPIAFATVALRLLPEVL